MTLFSEIVSAETLFSVRLTLYYAFFALGLAWFFALLLFRVQSKNLFELLELLWVLPGFAYALIILFLLRSFQVDARYSMLSVLAGWVLAGTPYLTLSFRQAWGDLDRREREALQILGASPWQRFFYFDFRRTWTSQRSALFQQFWLFLTSFSLVMILSGGPPNETMEVAIYTSVRLSQNHLPHAWALGIWQMVILLSLRLLWKADSEAASGWAASVKPRPYAWQPLAVALATACLVMKWCLSSELELDGFAPSFFTSLLLASGVAVFCLGYSLFCFYQKLSFVAEIGAWVSPMLISLLLWKSLGFIWPPLVCCFLLQIFLFAPWVARSLFPLLARARLRELEAARSLGASGFRAWREVEWHRLKGSIFWMLGFLFSLSLTEVTSVLLFSRNNFEPLSVWVQNSFLRFRLPEAAFGTFVLVMLSYLAVRRGRSVR